MFKSFHDIGKAPQGLYQADQGDTMMYAQSKAVPRFQQFRNDFRSPGNQQDQSRDKLGHGVLDNQPQSLEYSFHGILSVTTDSSH